MGKAKPETVLNPDPKQRLIEHVAELAVCMMPARGSCSPGEAVELVWKCYTAARMKVENEWPNLRALMGAEKMHAVHERQKEGGDHVE